MVKFDDIYENARGYRQEMIELNQLVQQLSDEKAKSDPVVAWFRLRYRRINEVIEPMKIEIDKRIKQIEYNLNRVEETKNDLMVAKSSALNGNLVEAKRIAGEYDIETINNSNEIIAQIDKLNNKNEKSQIKLEEEFEKHKECATYIRSAQSIINYARKAKEIDHASVSEAIRRINDWKKTLDIDVPDMKELPAGYKDEAVENLHIQIRAVVARLDNRYKMRIFAAPMKIIRIIIHDVGNDRGKKAFANRSRELMSACNESIDIFNNKYWQITGQRWQHVEFDGRCDYVSVKATHPKIPNA